LRLSLGRSHADADDRLPAVRQPGRYVIARRIEEHVDAKLNDLLEALADCPTARSPSIYDRCKAVHEALTARCREAFPLVNECTW
jgi:hypothetical protein